MFKRIILLLSIIFLSQTLELKSQFDFEIYSYDKFQITSVDTINYPRYSAKLRAKYDGIYVTLSTSNIFIIENNLVSQPYQIEQPDGQGWQTITWITKMRGPFGGDLMPLPLDFVVTYQNKTSRRTGANWHKSMAQVRVNDRKEQFLDEINFGIIPIGKDTSRLFYLYAATAKIIDTREQPVRIDSIKTHSPNFTTQWEGSIIDSRPPPLNIISPFEYFTRINFKPTEKKYYRDKFSVYYEGGLKDEIVMTGNWFDIPNNTTLQLVKPNGNEIIPSCMDYEVKWKGNVKGIPTLVEYSIDNGNTWKPIANVDDSSFIWKVPKVESNSAIMRVKQEFQTSYTRFLRYDDIPVRNVTYRSDGDKILAVHEDGKIVEWTLADYSNSQPYRISNTTYPSERIMPVGIEYFDDNKKFAVAYYNTKYNPQGRLDSIAFFEIGTLQPYLKVPIEQGFITRRMLIDPKRQNLVLINKLNNQIYVLNIENGSLIKKVDFQFPISAFAFNPIKEEAVVAFLNNEVQVINYPDFSIRKRLDFSDIPMIIELGISPSSGLLAIGCKAPFSTIVSGNRNEIHVADIESGMIVRTIRNTASDPLGLAFSPSSTILLIGSTAQPQIAFWDLPPDNYLGSITGNEGILTDFKFSPEGHSIVSSAASTENLTVRFFTYPESDTCDAPFRIVRPEMIIDTIKIEPKYIATNNEYEFDSEFCNTGEVPIILDDAYLEWGYHYKLKNSITPDTVFPGQCLKIPMVYHPLDTGYLVDKLKIYSCSGEFDVNIQSYGMKRNISFYENLIDMGEFCVGNKTYKEVLLARNDDPVPLKINKIEIEDFAGSPFKIIPPVVDTILQPGESIKVTIEFYPSNPGAISRNIVIYHSDQTKFKSSNNIKGFGLGASVQFSHNDLVFIPEILSRKLSLKNVSVHDIVVEGFSTSQSGIFNISAAIPQVLVPNQTMDFDVDWTGVDFTTDVTLTIRANPCDVNFKVNLGKFAGSSDVSFTNIEADPRGEATIPILFNNTDYRNYNGVRFFETEFSINPRIFLPLSISSELGTATIIKNEVKDDIRTIGVKVEGNFPEKGVIANIKGVAGLAEIEVSPINFNNNSAFWGKSVLTTSHSGSFKLINLCGNRKILQNGITSYIKSIKPNPVIDKFLIDYETDQNGEITIEIYDFLGNKVFTSTDLKVNIGINSIDINSLSLPNGSYTIKIIQNSSIATGLLLIVR